MPKWKYRRNNAWHEFGTTPPLTVFLAQPGSSGQTHPPGFTFSFTTSDDSRVVSFQLFYLVAGSPVLIGETTTQRVGWAIDLPHDFELGTFTFFGRAITADGSFDSPHVSVTIAEEAEPTVTIDMIQPSSSGQTFELPFDAAFSVSDRDAVSKVELFRADPVYGFQKLGEDTDGPGPLGWTIQVPADFQTGQHEIWGRAVLADGSGVDSVHRTVTFTAAPVSPGGSRSLQQAIFTASNGTLQGQIENRMGHQMPGFMQFGDSSSSGARTSQVRGRVDTTINRRNSDRYMFWDTYQLCLPGENLNSINSSGWQNVGAELNRLTVDDLRNLYGIRLGWEFQGAWFRHGITNTGLNGSNILANCDKYAARFRQAVDAMRSQMSADKAAALQLDWNSNGGSIWKQRFIAGQSQWTVADRCYPGDNHVAVISCDLYNSWEWRRNQGQYQPNGQGAMNPYGANGPFTYCRTRAIQHGKKTGMSEGGPVFIKWQDTGSGNVFRGAMPSTSTNPDVNSNLGFLKDLLDWGEEEAEAGRLSHITMFERNKGEGFFSFIIGVEPHTAAKSGGSEGAASLYPGADYLTGTNPAPPDMRALNARAYTRPGSTRSGSNNVQSNDPVCLNYLLDRVGGPLR